MAEANSPQAEAYLGEITDQAREEGKLDQMSEVADTLLASAASRIDALEKSIEAYTLHQQLGSLAEVLNLAFIARNYFGKTRQWLYQRLKGLVVNGKPASFTPEEESRFRDALNDIGQRIADFNASR